MPPILAAYFVTGGNIPAVIWSVCTIVISVFVFLPFFKMAEKKQLEKEAAESQENLEPVLNSEI